MNNLKDFSINPQLLGTTKEEKDCFSPRIK